MWYIYIIKCSDNSYYIGHTNFLKERIETHNAGKAAKWTANRLPVKLVYNEIYADKIQAIKRERQLKKWSRRKKEALIMGNIEVLRTLSKSRQNQDMS